MTRIKSLWMDEHVSRNRKFRKKHVDLAAKPNWRRLQQPKKKDLPNLNLGDGMIWPIRSAALHYKTSERIKKLALPKQKVVPTPEYLLPRPEEHLCGPYPGGHYASPTAQRAICNKRVEQIALPKYIYVINTKKSFENLLGSSFKEYMEDLTHKIEDVFPPPEIIRWSEIQPKKVPLTSAEKTKLQEWLQLRTKPKKEHEPPRRRVKRVKLKKLMHTFRKLSRPLERRKPQVEEDPFKISPAALKYEATERMRELAKPKERQEDKGLIPGSVSKAALKYKVTPRTLELARPRERLRGPDPDVKENPFSVNPKALKAICTKRTKELAEPIRR